MQGKLGSNSDSSTKRPKFFLGGNEVSDFLEFL